VVGINTALRISDLLQLRIGHFIDNHKRIRQRFWIKEQKCNKRHAIVINQSIREALNEYLAAYPV
jgi:integrase